jgi:hypothetical protein
MAAFAGTTTAEVKPLQTGGPLSPNARDFFQQYLKISQDAVLVSIETHVREKCLAYQPNELIQPSMTPCGQELLKACRP